MLLLKVDSCTSNNSTSRQSNQRNNGVRSIACLRSTLSRNNLGDCGVLAAGKTTHRANLVLEALLGSCGLAVDYPSKGVVGYIFDASSLIGAVSIGALVPVLRSIVVPDVWVVGVGVSSTCKIENVVCIGNEAIRGTLYNFWRFAVNGRC